MEISDQLFLRGSLPWLKTTSSKSIKMIWWLITSSKIPMVFLPMDSRPVRVGGVKEVLGDERTGLRVDVRVDQAS
jgi:hypothetical protein